jgi:hypothetical protein
LLDLCCAYWIGTKKFRFSFLLILDEGGLREGWVKPAYSSLAATGRIITNQQLGKTVVKWRQNSGKSAAKRRPLIYSRMQHSAARPRRIGSETWPSIPSSASLAAFSFAFCLFLMKADGGKAGKICLFLAGNNSC